MGGEMAVGQVEEGWIFAASEDLEDPPSVPAGFPIAKQLLDNTEQPTLERLAIRTRPSANQVPQPVMELRSERETIGVGSLPG
jgi:hypothetical protein